MNIFAVLFLFNIPYNAIIDKEDKCDETGLVNAQ